MAHEREQRRLAAILIADVVGYSRLMGADESGTLGALRTHRSELIDPKIDAYRGRIVKTMGDGLLVEFPSVVEVNYQLGNLDEAAAFFEQSAAINPNFIGTRIYLTAVYSEMGAEEKTQAYAARLKSEGGEALLRQLG